MVLYCQMYEKKVPCSKKFQMVQYVRTATYIAASEKKCKTIQSFSKALISQPCNNSMIHKVNFCSDLCETLIVSNIHLKKT